MAEGYCHYIYETRIRVSMQNKVRSFVLLHVKDLFCRYRKKNQNSRRIVSTTESYIYLPYSALHNFTLVVKSGCPVENVHFKLDQHAWQSTGKLVAPLGHIIQITTISLSFMS